MGGIAAGKLDDHGMKNCAVLEKVDSVRGETDGYGSS